MAGRVVVCEFGTVPNGEFDVCVCAFARHVAIVDAQKTVRIFVE